MFAVLTDPAAHCAIDGTGWVQEPVDRAPLAEVGQMEFGGWLWRYDLAPLGPSGTDVTLTYDWSAVPRYIRDRGITFPPFGPEHLTNSLHHLAELAAPASRA